MQANKQINVKEKEVPKQFIQVRQRGTQQIEQGSGYRPRLHIRSAWKALKTKDAEPLPSKVLM